MKIDADLPCPGCKLKTTVRRIKKPGFLSPVVVNWQCGSCESFVLSKLTIPSTKGGRGELRADGKVTRASKLLLDLLVEEAEFRKSIEGGADGAQEATPAGG